MSHPINVKEKIRSVGGLPDGIQIYLFGSALEDEHDSDVDLLFVYDTVIIDPKDIYAQLEAYFGEVASLVGRHVHPVVLSVKEEKQIQFARNEGCVAIS